jgi:hypothetical protein
MAGSTPEIEALTAAFYAAFDNRGDRTPTADALLAVFSDEATITRVANDGVESWEPEAFVSPRIAMLTDGTLAEFHEWETTSRTVVSENIASRWSTYEKEWQVDGAVQRGGGQKFIQLHRRRGRWLISSILWEDT